jgi:hypothetical protein
VRALSFSGFLSPTAWSVTAARTWFDRRRLGLLNTLVVLFIVGPVVTPLLLAGGATSTATGLYRFFHLRDTAVFTEGPTLNYTTVLNVAFLVLAAVLVWRFLRTGGPEMLKMMDVAEPADEHVTQAPA